MSWSKAQALTSDNTLTGWLIASEMGIVVSVTNAQFKSEWDESAGICVGHIDEFGISVVQTQVGVIFLVEIRTGGI